MNNLFERIWYRKNFIAFMLYPLSVCYLLALRLRHYLYRSGCFLIHHIQPPVVIVGNITVGGGGKTPLVIWLADYLKQQGFHPGIISRGYGADVAQSQAILVKKNSNPRFVGDEPLLIRSQSDCPVAICKHKYVAADLLIRSCACDIIISDDGLQHYALARDIEILTIDGQSMFGNRFCFPAGPLRESLKILKQVDLLVSKYKDMMQAERMDYAYADLRSLRHPSNTSPISLFKNKKIHAIAGIANPRPYFDYLKRQKCELIEHHFPDHHQYCQQDIIFDDEHPVVMTEKDSVKCRLLLGTEQGPERYWYLPIQATLKDSFKLKLNKLIQEVKNNE